MFREHIDLIKSYKGNKHKSELARILSIPRSTVGVIKKYQQYGSVEIIVGGAGKKTIHREGPNKTFDRKRTLQDIKNTMNSGTDGTFCKKLLEEKLMILDIKGEWFRRG